MLILFRFDVVQVSTTEEVLQGNENRHTCTTMVYVCCVRIYKSGSATATEYLLTTLLELHLPNAMFEYDVCYASKHTMSYL